MSLLMRQGMWGWRAVRHGDHHSEVGDSTSITAGFGAACPSSCLKNAGRGACQTAVCGDGSGRGYGDDDSCCWQCSRSRVRSQCWSPRSPISQPHLPALCPEGVRCSSRWLSPVGGRAVPAARDALHLGEGCCGGRRSSGTGADRAKLLAGGCLQGGCSTAASINLWGTSASATRA